MGKNKLKRFNENDSFERVFQPKLDEVFGVAYSLKGKWHSDVFKNNHPIVLELGCGRGEYTVEMAQHFPEKNFIGIDIKGARLWRGAKTAHEENLQNAAFLRIRIEFITQCFAENEISEIWITFPDPQRKNQRAKKRLTSSRFLDRYRLFLEESGCVHLKTDSFFLHEYTKALLKDNNLPIFEAFTDIYKQCPDNTLLSIKTHYEAQYLKQGIPISYLKFAIKGTDLLIEPKDFDPEIY